MNYGKPKDIFLDLLNRGVIKYLNILNIRTETLVVVVGNGRRMASYQGG